MKKQLFVVMVAMLFVGQMFAMMRGKDQGLKKQSIFFDKKLGLCISKACREKKMYDQECTKTVDVDGNVTIVSGEKKERVKEELKLASIRLDESGNLVLYSWFGSSSVCYFHGDKKELFRIPPKNHGDCTWFGEKTDETKAFNHELEYLKDGKKNLENDLGKVSLLQKIWNYKAYNRSLETLQILKQEIDIFENKNNSFYHTNKDAFCKTFKPSYYTEKE